jgi:hypothetical protein
MTAATVVRQVAVPGTFSVVITTEGLRAKTPWTIVYGPNERPIVYCEDRARAFALADRLNGGG